MAREFLDGNEAIARGALASSCNFFAGYPITPASTILQHMLRWLPPAGGIAIQAEDEIASIGFCIGASMAGSKALTATSGPGLSLYSENIGLAIIGETPLVIVDVQRQGPATGSATKGADGDVQFCRWSTSGGLPIIALCPSTVEEAFELTYRAFNFAEAYRTPVFLLTNKELGMTREVADLDSIVLPPLVERTQVGPGPIDYAPHRFVTPDETPAFSPFGGEQIARYTTSSHDQDGFLTGNPAVIEEMLDHYSAKILAASNSISLFKEDLQPDAKTLIVSYGVTSRAVAVAVAEARRSGRRVSSLVLQTLWPVPEDAIRRSLEGVDRVIVPEMNLGQYVLEIQRLAPERVEVVAASRMNTRLISPAEISAELETS